MGTQVVKATLVRVMNRTKYIASDTILRQVEAEPTEIPLIIICSRLVILNQMLTDKDKNKSLPNLD